MGSLIVNATKAAITIACGGVGYAVSQACAPGSDGKGGFAAGVAVGNALQGVVSNYGKDVGDWLSGAVGTLTASTDGPATNHDLDELAAQAIAKCLRIAKEYGKGTDGISLFAAALAQTDAGTLRDLLREPAFADTDDAAVLMLIGQRNGGMGMPAQTAPYWESYVRALAQKLGVAVPSDAAVTFVAGWVYRELAAQANDILRNTFGPQGRPYVAVQMLFAQQTLTAVIKGDRTTHASLERIELKLADFMKILEGIVPGIKGALRVAPSTVPTPSATFVPRKYLTAQIHKKLQEHPDKTVIRQVVARAFGGYGKTVAAILYADEYQAHYPGGRFFLRMEQGDIVQQLASLTTALGIASVNNPAADAEKVKGTLEGGEPSLLILDNVEHKSAWEAMRQTGFVPRGRCRVLITTRDEHVAPGSDIQVGRLAPEEAREVYRLFCEGRKVREDDAEPLPSDATADAITAWLGGLAVAVAAVAALLRLKPRLSWEVYWTGDGKGFKGLKDRALCELPDVSPDVFAALRADEKDLREHRRTLHVIDQAFDALPQAEQRAVEYAALLPADLAPASWLEKLVTDDVAREAGPMKIDLPHDTNEPGTPVAAVLAHLDALDILLRGGEEGKLLSLHRLWHVRVNERAEAAKADRAPLLRAIATCAHTRRGTIVGKNPDGTDRSVDNPVALTDQTLRWELTPLAAMCAHLWNADEAGGAARVGVWLMGPLQVLGRYAEAAACLAPVAQHEAAVEAVIGPEDFAACYSNLALIQKDQGDLPGARASMERAIAIDSEHFAPDHPIFGTRYSNLALIQQAQGDLRGARASMERAITIAAKHLGLDHPDLATMSSNLAMIQKDQGDLPGARTSMERAIAIESKHFAPDHPTVAVSWSNLATIQQDHGDLPGARASMERAIAIASKHFAPDHPAFATSYSNLATIQRRQGDLPGARASMERAIAIQSKHFTPDHPTFGISYTNLATICYHEGDRAAACTNFTKALTIFLKHFDENHPLVKSVRASMKAAGCPQ